MTCSTSITIHFAKGLASLPALASAAIAANSFTGSNLYYAAGLSSSQQDTLFKGMQSSECSETFHHRWPLISFCVAGMKVLRVWVDKESTATTKVSRTPLLTSFLLTLG